MIDITNIQELLVAMSWLTPVLVALVGVLRGAFKIPSRWVPLISAVIGTAGALWLMDMTKTAAVVGLIIGLTASGAYDLAKKSIIGA